MGRFSIALMMAVVLFCGVVAAGVKHATDAWAGVSFSITVLLLVVSLIGILQRRGEKQAFWQGFALFGWTYFVLTLAPWFSENVGPTLPTAEFLTFVHEKGNPRPEVYDLHDLPGVTAHESVPMPQAPALIHPGLFKGSYWDVARWYGPGGNRGPFVRVGHCLFAGLMALLGAGLARWFHRTNKTE